MEDWVGDVLQVGYLLPFEFYPLLTDRPLFQRTYLPGLPKDLALQNQVQEEMKGKLETPLTVLAAIRQNDFVDNRPEGCLLPDPNSPVISQVPSIGSGRDCIS